MFGNYNASLIITVVSIAKNRNESDNANCGRFLIKRTSKNGMKK